MNEDRPTPTVSITVPAEVWGYLVAGAFEHRQFKSNRTRAELAQAAVAFVSAGLKNGGALETDASFASRAKAREANEPVPPPEGGGL